MHFNIFPFGFQIAPPVPLLQDFIYHWKQVMRFYDSSDEGLDVPIESTHLPIHLEEMLTVYIIHFLWMPSENCRNCILGLAGRTG